MHRATILKKLVGIQNSAECGESWKKTPADYGTVLDS